MSVAAAIVVRSDAALPIPTNFGYARRVLEN
jgi:hypothetical protein